MLLEAEKAHGRVRTERDGPRTIDLDLLLYGDRILNEPGLIVPHPRMHERLFVLLPLAQIAPDLRQFPADRERFVTTVKLGKNNRMPPWGDLLSDDEIARLWAYVSSRRNP